MKPLSPSQFSRITLALFAMLALIALATTDRGARAGSTPAPASGTGTSPASPQASASPTSATLATAHSAAAPTSASPARTFDFPAPGTARVITMDGLRRLLKEHGAKVLVVNFWATTCGPCIEEMPHFIEVYSEYKSRGVLFVGISQDFLDEWKDVVPPFLVAKKVPYPNFVVDADPNDFVNFFSPEWSGAIPATFLYDANGKLLDKTLTEISKKDLVAKVEGALKQAKP